MKRKAHLALNALIGIIVIAITLVVFFVSNFSVQKTAIDYFSLTFVLVSEVVLFGTMIILSLTDNSTVLSYRGILATLVGYWFVTLAATIIFNPILKSVNNINAFIYMEIAIIAAAVVVCIIIIAISKARNIRESAIASAGVVMQGFENDIFTLKKGVNDKELAEKLESLYENIKYSDHSSSISEKETAIRAKINELGSLLNAGSASVVAAGKIDEIAKLVLERDEIIRKSKKGGF